MGGYGSGRKPGPGQVCNDCGSTVRSLARHSHRACVSALIVKLAHWVVRAQVAERKLAAYDATSSAGREGEPK